MTSDNHALNGLQPQAIQKQLDSILESELFANSPRMVRFLRFAVQESLAGNAEQLKEVVIGSKVFDRETDYDPRLDPIVRVEARRLRRKLSAYYQLHGAKDEVFIELPKGRYAPAFRPAGSQTAPASSAECPSDEVTVAVLPFQSFDAGMDASCFSDGLSEELIHALTGIQGLGVVAWHSAAQLRHEQEDIAAVRQRLGATHVLRGSVRTTKDCVRITAQLIQTSDRHYVWSEAFDRQIEDVFAIQKEIANSIAVALNLRFRKASQIASPSNQAQSLEAYQLYLKGRFHARARTLEGLTKSLAFFEEAIAADSRSVLAYSGLADTYALIAEYGFADGCDCMTKAKAAVERALELDPLSAEGHASLGLILTLYDRDWVRAGQVFQRSLQLNPGYATAHFWYGGDHLAMLGRLEEAEAEVNVALRLDPLSPMVRIGRGQLRIFARQYEAAINEFEIVAQADPSFFRAHASIGRANLLQGRYSEAIDVLEKARALSGSVPSVLGALGQAYGMAGDSGRARTILSEMMSMFRYRPVSCTSLAMLHLGLGEKSEALGWLELGVERRQASVVALNVHPIFDDLRGEPAFKTLLRKVGL